MITSDGQELVTDLQKCPDCGADVIYLFLVSNYRKFGDKLLATRGAWEPYDYKKFNSQGHDYGDNITLTGQHECPITRPK